MTEWQILQGDAREVLAEMGEHRLLRMMLDPIRYMNRPMLRRVADNLKQGGSTGKAVGEMLARACDYLDTCELGERQEVPTDGVA